MNLMSRSYRHTLCHDNRQGPTAIGEGNAAGLSLRLAVSEGGGGLGLLRDVLLELVTPYYHAVYSVWAIG